MGLIDNIKYAFNQAPAAPTCRYGTTKEWFLSDAGRKALNATANTAELTDFTFHYLKAIMANKKLLSDEGLYRLAFIFADGMVNSNQPYAGKECLLSETAHPFIAYFQNLKRNLNGKNLCIEMLFILLGVVDPFNPTEWIYDETRQGFSEAEYQKIAEEHEIDFRLLFVDGTVEQDDLRLIMGEIIWLLGKTEFLDILA
jgi:hypothetical protein